MPDAAAWPPTCRMPGLLLSASPHTVLTFSPVVCAATFGRLFDETDRHKFDESDRENGFVGVDFSVLANFER